MVKGKYIIKVEGLAEIVSGFYQSLWLLACGKRNVCCRIEGLLGN
jgi:hypothetical protein